MITAKLICQIRKGLLLAQEKAKETYPGHTIPKTGNAEFRSCWHFALENGLGEEHPDRVDLLEERFGNKFNSIYKNAGKVTNPEPMSEESIIDLIKEHITSLQKANANPINTALPDNSNAVAQGVACRVGCGYKRKNKASFSPDHYWLQFTTKCGANNPITVIFETAPGAPYIISSTEGCYHYGYETQALIQVTHVTTTQLEIIKTAHKEISSLM